MFKAWVNASCMVGGMPGADPEIQEFFKGDGVRVLENAGLWESSNCYNKPKKTTRGVWMQEFFKEEGVQGPRKGRSVGIFNPPTPGSATDAV